jgi:hypothetical protein
VVSWTTLHSGRAPGLGQPVAACTLSSPCAWDTIEPGVYSHPCEISEIRQECLRTFRDCTQQVHACRWHGESWCQSVGSAGMHSKYTCCVHAHVVASLCAAQPDVPAICLVKLCPAWQCCAEQHRVAHVAWVNLEQPARNPMGTTVLVCCCFCHLFVMLCGKQVASIPYDIMAIHSAKDAGCCVTSQHGTVVHSQLSWLNKLCSP